VSAPRQEPVHQDNRWEEASSNGTSGACLIVLAEGGATPSLSYGCLFVELPKATVFRGGLTPISMVDVSFDT
jgi:hypothetical protein